MSLDIEWPRYPTDTGPTDISSPDIPEAESGFFVDYKVFDDVIGALQCEADALKPGSPPDSRPDNLTQWTTFIKELESDDPGYFLVGDYPAGLGLVNSCYQAAGVLYAIGYYYHSLFATVATLVAETKKQHLAAEDHAGDILAKTNATRLTPDGLTNFPEFSGGVPGPLIEDGNAWKENHDLGYYYDHIRQKATDGDWDAGYDDLYKMVHSLRPDLMDIAGTRFHGLANGIEDSRKVLYEQASDLAKGWHGATAGVALRCMERLYDLGAHIVSAAWLSGSALQWHADKQRAWQRAVKPKDDLSEFLDDWMPWNHVGDELKKAIQQQTVETTNAFPTSVASPFFS
ncbi:hypothetical protein [Actinoallomurus iriomotensis]|uniref:Uncharacterized protein n=1 Tax=Actinoallomurus iriomotensis TaxID=478107 RepID=A0A9W6VV63_9ACTN|nr:hypothetical protein [Actinoallomurus iriomotensis]GLY79416.1 hypothetical protein Airi01_076830 [Actinoallomurus iriomotensis]